MANSISRPSCAHASREALITAFTLIELLTVIAILATLAALLVPVFAQTKRSGLQTVCQSQLRQIGAATLGYCNDYHDRFPVAFDTEKRLLQDWMPEPSIEAEIARQRFTVPTWPSLLRAYGMSPIMLHCPEDDGRIGLHTDSQLLGYEVGRGDQIGPIYVPSAHAVVGNSYTYRAQLGWLGATSTSGCTIQDGRRELGTSGSGLYRDLGSFWHGERVLDGEGINLLFVDGHVRRVNRNGFFQAWFCNIL
jgi:prepilin-type N-terminal cleavage/methylation domain-containing protein/prepilin-type processing-associated H-X9-DG protein